MHRALHPAAAVAEHGLAMPELRQGERAARQPVPMRRPLAHVPDRPDVERRQCAGMQWRFAAMMGRDEVAARLEALAEFPDPWKLGPEPERPWREACQTAAAELKRLWAIFDAATEVQGDAEVLRYVTSGNAIPVTRCTVSADLIRQLVEGRANRPEAAPTWRLAKSDELPKGPPVEPGTTLYAFRHLDEGHWEYDLPAIPNAANSQESK